MTLRIYGVFNMKIQIDSMIDIEPWTLSLLLIYND